jgi:hypothetical protein
LQFGERAVDGKVADVDEDRAGGDTGLCVVCVGEADDFDGWGRGRLGCDWGSVIVEIVGEEEGWGVEEELGRCW